MGTNIREKGGMKAFLHFLVVLLLPFSVPADRVVFKNGRTMNGKILSETDTHVTILDGGLQLKLSKSRLARVERVDNKDPAASSPATHALGEAPPSTALLGGLVIVAGILRLIFRGGSGGGEDAPGPDPPARSRR